jgi:type IV fimbrial biogenesis protein FimT
MQQRGFTLMEMMMVLALTAVILAIGAPSFSEFRQNSQMTGVANDFLTTIVNARSEALKRQSFVAVCPSSTPLSDAATCDAADPTGWIAFTDTNGNCVRDVGDEIFATGARPSDLVTADGNGNCISFGNNGFQRTVAGRPSLSRAIFCDERGNVARGGTGQSTARGLELLPTGRAAVETRLATLTSWAGGAGPVACP